MSLYRGPPPDTPRRHRHGRRAAGASVDLSFDGIAAGLTVSFSGGVARPLPDAALDAAVERVDQAMYRAKTQGRRRSLVATTPCVAGDTASAARALEPLASA